MFYGTLLVFAMLIVGSVGNLGKGCRNLKESIEMHTARVVNAKDNSDAWYYGQSIKDWIKVRYYALL